MFFIFILKANLTASYKVYKKSQCLVVDILELITHYESCESFLKSNKLRKMINWGPDK